MKVTNAVQYTDTTSHALRTRATGSYNLMLRQREPCREGHEAALFRQMYGECHPDTMKIWLPAIKPVCMELHLRVLRSNS